MNVLLDEMIDVRFRHLTPGHDVYSVEFMKWKGVKNGALIAVAAANQFEAIVTVDGGMGHQQNPAILRALDLDLSVKGIVSGLPELIPAAPPRQSLQAAKRSA